ncbi:zinc finger associated protein [Popillia japonica]|uniref:Zinc finger associated protein n=1 Tax=Popillia japonica TaxID=7064 RepID=A0AAW1JUM6_POPJA
MYRTPPKASLQHSDAPLPDSPAEERADKSSMATRPQNTMGREDTPTPFCSGPSPKSESLTDEEILAQIKHLHSLLKKRRQNGSNRMLSADTSSDEERPSSGLSPLNMDTSFCSTSSLVRAMAPSTAKKRKGSSSPPSTPSRRIKVSALVHSPLGNRKTLTDGCLSSHQKTSIPKHGHKPGDDIDKIEVISQSEPTQTTNNIQSRRFPPLPSRPQRAQKSTTVPAQAIEKTRPDPPPAVSDAKIPPIVLRDKSRWSRVSSEIKRRGISFTKAQNIPDGIRIYPSSEADYRMLTKFFSDDQIPYHTYQLPSEKLLNVVLRGVPVEIEEKEIYDDLRERGFEPDSVIRMRRTRDKAPMPLVLVKISKDQKAIYHLDKGNATDVKNSGTPNSDVLQRGACAGDHEPGACERPKQVPATCANCGEEHPANYRGCARYPKSTLRTTRPTDSPADTTRARSRASPGLSQARPSRGSASSGVEDGGRSYSQAVTGLSRPQTQGSTSKFPKVRFSTGRSPRPPKDNPATDDSEDANVEILLDALQSLFIQIEKVTDVIKTILPRKRSRQS